MKRLALLSLLAGCFSDEAGLHIVVHDQHAGAHSIDMYIVADSDDVGAMTPLGATRPMAGRVLLLDGSVPPTKGALHDGEVVFNVLPKKADGALDQTTIVFIGRDPQGNAVSFGKMPTLSLEAGGSVAYRFDLQEAAFPVDHPSDDNRPSGTRIFEWQKTAGLTKCLDVEFAEDAADGGVIHYFFVPPEDRDCDGVLATANICPVENDYVYDSDRMTVAATPLLENAECGQTSQVGTHDVCALGAPPPPQCSSGGSTPDDCLPFTGPRFCAPQKVCEQDECLTGLATCVDAQGLANDWAKEGKGATFLRCAIAADPDGGACPINDNSSVTFDFNVKFHEAFSELAPAESLRCAGANLWVPQKVPGTQIAFYQTALIRTKMAIQAPPLSCNFKLSYGGNAVPAPFTPTQAFGGIDVTIGDGTSPLANHIVMPVRVSFIACAGTPHCEIIRGDGDYTSFAQCLPH
ncbi:hypothetical protein BH11MYX2_BH11MYX2_15290 [soil metagenome]